LGTDGKLKLSHEDIVRIACELHEEGFHNSEAYPIRRWKIRGYPEDPASFKIIDVYLRYLWELEKYLEPEKST
jgi:hypothetical protein